MNEFSVPEGEPDRRRVYYLVGPEDGVNMPPERPIEITQLLGILWQRGLLLLCSGFLLAVSAYLVSFVLEPRFSAEVVLSPTEEKTGSSVLGQFGGLATLAGISVGGGKTQEPLAILRSREFARQFIEAHNLLPLLFKGKWDSSKGGWRDPADVPDLRDAVQKFHASVMSVSEDTKSGLVSVRIKWFDANQAADLANALTRQLNADLQLRAVREAERNIAYLKAESETAHVVPLQQSIGRLLETEMQKHMLAKGNPEFAFKIIDAAVPPKRPAWPRPLLLAALGMVGGVVLAAVWVLARNGWGLEGRRERR